MILGAGLQVLAREPVVADSWEVLIRRTDTLHRQGKLADAELAGRMALLAAGGDLATEERLPLTHAVLASVYRDQGRCGEARASYARALALFEKQLNPRPKLVFNAIAGLINEACECDDFMSAQQLFRSYSPKLRQYRSAPEDEARIDAMQGAIARGEKHYAKAEQDFRRALTVLEKSGSGDPGDVAELRSSIGMLIGLQGRKEQGLAEIANAVAQMENISAQNACLPAALNNMGTLLVDLGRAEESRRTLRRAMDLARELFGDGSRKTAMIMLNYAAVLRDSGDERTASALEAKAGDVYRQSARRDSQTIDVKELEALRGSR